MPRTQRSVYPAYLSEPTPGMECPLASGLEQTFSWHLCCLHSLKFATKWSTWKLLRNLATVILAAHDLNEHGGKHRLLQTSLPMNDFKIQ